MYECFHCGFHSVIWQRDNDFEDYGINGDGIIHECICTHCGARITYYVPNNSAEDCETADGRFEL